MWGNFWTFFLHRQEKSDFFRFCLISPICWNWLHGLSPGSASPYFPFWQTAGSTCKYRLGFPRAGGHSHKLSEWHQHMTPNRVNRAHWPTKENRHNFLVIFRFSRPTQKIAWDGPNCGREVLFPINPYLADILGDTEFDFENFDFLDVLAWSQISGMPSNSGNMGEKYFQEFGPIFMGEKDFRELVPIFCMDEGYFWEFGPNFYGWNIL